MKEPLSNNGDHVLEEEVTEAKPSYANGNGHHANDKNVVLKESEEPASPIHEIQQSVKPSALKHQIYQSVSNNNLRESGKPRSSQK